MATNSVAFSISIIKNSDLAHPATINRSHVYHQSTRLPFSRLLGIYQAQTWLPSRLPRKMPWKCHVCRPKPIMPIPGFRDHCRVCGHVRCQRCSTVKPIRIGCALEDGHDDQDNEILGRTVIYTPEAHAGLDKEVVVAGKDHVGSFARLNASATE